MYISQNDKCRFTYKGECDDRRIRQLVPQLRDLEVASVLSRKK